MLDMIGALAFAAILVIDVIVLVGLAPSRPRTEVIAFAIAAAWAATVVAIAAAGGFAPGSTGPFDPSHDRRPAAVERAGASHDAGSLSAGGNADV